VCLNNLSELARTGFMYRVEHSTHAQRSCTTTRVEVRRRAVAARWKSGSIIHLRLQLTRHVWGKVACGKALMDSRFSTAWMKTGILHSSLKRVPPPSECPNVRYHGPPTHGSACLFCGETTDVHEYSSSVSADQPSPPVALLVHRAHGSSSWTGRAVPG